MNRYQVTVANKTPAYGEHSSEIEVFASTAAEAIRRARQTMRWNGHTRQDGALTYKAKRDYVS